MRKQHDNVNQSGKAHTPVAAGTAPQDDVLDLVHTVMHQYRSQQYQVLRDGPHDVTHMESKVLGYFGRHAGATQSQLSAHTGRDKAQLARLIKGLRERGLLAGEVGLEDRRSVRLSLTAAGQSVLRALLLQGRRLSAKAVAGFSSAEERQLSALLQRVKTNLGAED